MTYNSLAFLNEDTLILPNIRDNAIELCSFTRKSTWIPTPFSSHGDNGFVMLDTSSNCLPLPTTKTLKLPATREGVSILRMACRGEPNPLANNSIPQPVKNGPLLRPIPESSIVIFNLLVSNRAHRSISFVVNRESLLRLLERDDLEGCNTPQLDEDEPTVAELEENPFATSPQYSVADTRGPPSFVPWGSWGTSAVRWFMTDDIPTRWITTSCGYRWATIAEELPSPIYFRDFNPWRIGQAKLKLAGREAYETERTVVTVARPGSPTLEEESIFVDPVSSDLEYLEVRTKEEYSYSSVFMDENWILGIIVSTIVLSFCICEGTVTKNACSLMISVKISRRLTFILYPRSCDRAGTGPLVLRGELSLTILFRTRHFESMRHFIDPRTSRTLFS